MFETVDIKYLATTVHALKVDTAVNCDENIFLGEIHCAAVPPKPISCNVEHYKLSLVLPVSINKHEDDGHL